MKLTLGTVVAALILAYAFYAIITIDHRPDSARINEIILKTAEAIENKNLSATMEYVSSDYEDEVGYSYETLRMFIANVYKGEIKYKVLIGKIQIQIDENQAFVDVPVKITYPNDRLIYQSDLKVTFVKENTRRALFIPTSTWKVVNIQNIGSVPQPGF